MKNSTIITILLLLPCFIILNLVTAQDSYAQNKGNAKIDSLLTELKNAKEATGKVNILNTLSYEKRRKDPEQAKKYANQALELAEILDFKKGIAEANTNIGNAYRFMGNYDKTLSYSQQSLELYQSLAESSDTKLARSGEKGMATVYNIIGLVYYQKTSYDKALEYFQRSLKIQEKIDDKNGIANSYTNIGNVHWHQNDYSLAIEYHKKALMIREDIGDNNGIADCYNNIGNISFEQGKYDKSIKYFIKSSKIYDELGDNYGLAISYNNIGYVYYNQGKYKKAIEYYQKSLKIKEKIDEKEGIAMTLGNIAELNNKLGNYNKAITYAQEALKIAKDIGVLNIEGKAYKQLSESYKGLNNLNKALEYKDYFIVITDRIFSDEKTKAIAEMQTRYETEKKEKEIQFLNKENQLQEETVKRQRILIYSLVLIFAIIIVFTVIVLKQSRKIKKANIQLAEQNNEILQQKEEIEAQRDEIETQRDTVLEQKNHIEKINKEVIDSIHYAQYIQSAILPQPELRDQLFGEHFIFFKPRNIVSGDFYWVTKVEGRTIIAVADCTGHGVPGAFMSMLGLSYLNEVINNEYITHPGVILRRLRKKVISTLKQKGESGEQRDGMDISLCSIDYDTLKLEFSGANNPVYILRNRNYEPISNTRILESDEYILYEIKGDKMPIAMYDKMDKFQTHEIQLQKGDCIYLFSDGYADQFGGPEGKKFKYKPFKKLLLTNCQKTMGEQQLILDQALSTWQQECEQVDDILVVGIKI